MNLNMTYFTTELKSIFIFVIASLVLSLILFLAVYIMSFTSKVEFEKSSAYECGFAPFSETNYPFEVQFALIAIMFLLFDIEVLYLYPLVTSISDLTFSDMIWFFMFFIVLCVGIVYEISRRVMAMSDYANALTVNKPLEVSLERALVSHTLNKGLSSISMLVLVSEPGFFPFLDNYLCVTFLLVFGIYTCLFSYILSYYFHRILFLIIINYINYYTLYQIFIWLSIMYITRTILEFNISLVYAEPSSEILTITIFQNIINTLNSLVQKSYQNTPSWLCKTEAELQDYSTPFVMIVNSLENLSSNITLSHSSIAIIVVSSSKQKKVLFLFLILCFAVIWLINFPIILLLFMILLSTVPFLAWIPSSWKLSQYSKPITNTFIDLFIGLGLYKYIYNWYQFLNCNLTLKGFKVLIVILALFFLFYLGLARYILYLKFELQIVPLWIYILFFIASIGLILRSITTFSMFIIPFMIYNYPHHLAILHSGPEMPTEIPPSPSASTEPPTKKYFGGLYNRHIHHHYPNTPEIPRSFFQRNLGFGVACAGLCLSTFACYQYYKSANAAVTSALEAKRAADIAARQAGLITDDQYYKRHPSDKPIEQKK